MPRGSAAWGASPGMILAFVVGCSEGTDRAVAPIVVVDSVGVSIVSNDLSRLESACVVSSEPKVTIGASEEDETDQLYRVFGATVLRDGRIALVNGGSAELRLYSAEGSFLSAVGGEGQGPGEFENAFLLWNLPGDTLWVGDYRPWVFEVFGPTGEWVRQVRPSPPYLSPPWVSGILSDGRLVLADRDIELSDPFFELDSIYVALHDATGALIDTVQVLPNARWGQTVRGPGSVWLYPWFESFAEFAARGDRLVFGHGSRSELLIYDMDPNMRLSRIVRWSDFDRSVSASLVEASRDEVRKRYADSDERVRQWLLVSLLHEDRPVAGTIPAFVNVLIGTDDAIWIERYRMPNSPPEADWTRFDPMGRFECHAKIPSGLQVYEFGRDYILGEATNELGVETVVLYSLSKPW